MSLYQFTGGSREADGHFLWEILSEIN
uniref:Uncharacterized protein n=1 Tax=Arundo donax TaxID=35708 RepID=A0A0A9AMK3_ARUDO